MEVGEYAFDVPYGNSWILVHFRVEDRPDDLGLLQMLEQGELREAEIMSDVYDYEMDLSVTGVMMLEPTKKVMKKPTYKVTKK